MNQSQFVHKVMKLLFGDEYEYLNDTDCSYELAIGMIKKVIGQLNKTIRRSEVMSIPHHEDLREYLLETIGEWASPELKDRLHEHNAWRKRMSLGEILDAVEEEFQRRSL